MNITMMMYMIHTRMSLQLILFPHSSPTERPNSQHTPRVPHFGKPMQQDDQGTLSCRSSMQSNAIGLHVSMGESFHGKRLFFCFLRQT